MTGVFHMPDEIEIKFPIPRQAQVEMDHKNLTLAGSFQLGNFILCAA